MSEQEKRVLVVGPWQCPENWPTHHGSSALWEALGKTVGAFSVLENILPRALHAITGHARLKAALKDPDSVLQRELAGLVSEIAILRRVRNRLCHGAWTSFETPTSATVRFFPQGEELDKTHQKFTSLDDLSSTQNRVMAVIAELETKVEQAPIHDPGKPLWEEIGRTVATFGMLEDLVPRALYILTGHQFIDDAEDERQQVEKWCATLVKSMSDTLGGLACSLEAAWKERDGCLNPESSDIVQEFRALAKVRNRVCHATYQEFLTPDADVGQMNPPPQNPKLDHQAREVYAIDALQNTRVRVVAVVAALRTEVRVRYQAGFPGANDL